MGFHGALWFVMPLLPANSAPDEPGLPESVAMVELTPEEMSRVPDFSQSQRLRLPPADANRDLPELDQDFNLDSNTSRPQGGLHTLYDDYLRELELRSNSHSSGATHQRSTASNQSPPPPPPLPLQQSAQTNTSEAQPTDDASDRDQQPDDSLQDSGETTNLPDLMAANPNAVEDGAEQDEGVDVEDDVAAIAAAIQAERDAMNEELSVTELLAYSELGTSPQDASGALGTFVERWRPTLEEQGVEEFALGQLEITGDFPGLACSLETSPFSRYGVALDESGELLDAPRLIQSSGYPVFNRSALETLMEYEFEPGDTARIELVTVLFNYDEEVCAQIALPEGESSDRAESGGNASEETQATDDDQDDAGLDEDEQEDSPE
ncbi:MAG: hypothetical protein EA367_12645 [Leptolyngbya sp. DLM2.Bin15]|nr:MAG: hypothetical protein EA367_12645 [Leptolyngbya sp. DLM2.Bin15]